MAVYAELMPDTVEMSAQVFGNSSDPMRECNLLPDQTDDLNDARLAA